MKDFQRQEVWSSPRACTQVMPGVLNQRVFPGNLPRQAQCSGLGRPQQGSLHTPEDVSSAPHLNSSRRSPCNKRPFFSIDNQEEALGPFRGPELQGQAKGKRMAGDHECELRERMTLGGLAG